MTAISVENLAKSYGDKLAVGDVSFEVKRGEVFALLGPNGAGKTTTIEVLEGFRAPSAGQVCVLGVDPLHGGEAWRARVGIVLQSWRDHGKWRCATFWPTRARCTPRTPHRRSGGPGTRTRCSPRWG